MLLDRRFALRDATPHPPPHHPLSSTTKPKPGPGVCNILRRAPQLFSHVADALTDDAFAAGAGAELCLLLQKQLLPNAAYCRRAAPAAFQALLERVMRQADRVAGIDSDGGGGGGGGRSARPPPPPPQQQQRGGAARFEELQRLAALALALLQGMPGAPAPRFLEEELLPHFAGLVKWMDEHG